MKGRANSSTTFSNFLHLNSNSLFPCDKHPFSSSSVGICPHCLNDRLSKLVCSDCGERRASSCSCSETLFHRNSCSNVDVGRISFLIDRQRGSLRRSSSSSSSGFSRIKGLFGKRREKIEFCGEKCGDEASRIRDEMEVDRFCEETGTETEMGFLEVKLDSWKRGGRRRSIGCDDLKILGSLRRSGRSCINERGFNLKKQGTRTSKLWKWIFKNPHQN